MSDKKRVFCLYRVSTAGQLDRHTRENEKDDIPMQKRACEEFCASKGWEIVDSRSDTDSKLKHVINPIATSNAAKSGISKVVE